MALLKTESGEIYLLPEAINGVIAPNEMGNFRSDEAVMKLVAKPLDEKSSVEIYKYIPKAMDQYCREKGLQPTKALTVWEGSDPKVKERVEISMQPHINHGREVHFLLAGGFIFYMVLGSKIAALVLQAGDWIFVHPETESWVKMTDDHYFTFASYHSAPLAPVDEFHKTRVFTHRKTDKLLLFDNK